MGGIYLCKPSEGKITGWFEFFRGSNSGKAGLHPPIGCLSNNKKIGNDSFSRSLLTNQQVIFFLCQLAKVIEIGQSFFFFLFFF